MGSRCRYDHRDETGISYRNGKKSLHGESVFLSLLGVFSPRKNMQMFANEQISSSVKSA